MRCRRAALDVLAMLVLMNGVEAFSFLTIGNARDSRAVTLGRKGCAAWPTARPRTGLTSLRASTEVIAIAKAAAAAGGDALLRPFWLNEIWGLTSVIILIGLLYEKAEKALKRAVPQTFLPVINAMLNELGALGFISALVFLSTHQGVGLSMLKKLAALFGSSMHHVIHDFELLHFALFAVVNLYFVQVLFVIFGVIKTYQKIEAFDKVQFSGGGSSPSKWEDRDSRIAIIKSMSMYQASKPDSSLQEKISRYVSNLFGWDRQIGEFFLFRERMRLKIGSHGLLDFTAYMEKSIGRALKTLVHIPGRGWVTFWAMFTVAITLKQYLQLHGVTSAMALFGIIASGHLILLGGALWMLVKVSQIKDMLRPRLTARALELVRKSESGGLSSTPIRAVTVFDKMGAETDLWDSSVLLHPPKYLDLPDGEQPAWKSKLRSIFHLRDPRNKHERLFGLYGANGPKIYTSILQAIFFLSTILLTSQITLLSNLALSYKLVTISMWAFTMFLLPAIMMRLNFAISTEELTDYGVLSEILEKQRQKQFLVGIRAILAFLVLFQNGDNNLNNKIEVLRKLRTLPPDQVPQRRAVEEEYQELQKLPQEEIGLLQYSFNEVASEEFSTDDIEANLDKKGLHLVLSNLGVNLDDEQIDILFEYMDRAKNDLIDFKEFATALLLPAPGMPPLDKKAFDTDIAADAANRLFEVIDLNDDGNISLDEFQGALTTIYPSWNPESLVGLFRELDYNNTGLIDKEDLDKFVRKALSTTV